jgi:hypothetical protein
MIDKAVRERGPYRLPVDLRAGILVLPLLMAGCERAVNSFEVHTPGAASAELQLCGRLTSLEPSGGKLTATRAISCEGEGAIIVRFPNQPPVRCPIGYVTPGAVQSFRFNVDGDGCSPFGV